MVRPGGRLLITTPNRITSSPGRDTPLNPFHTRELNAAELFARVLELDPEHVEAGEPLAEIYFRDEQWQKLEPILDMLVRKADQQGKGKDNKELNQLYYRLARTGDELGNFDKAIRFYKAAYDLDSTFLPTLLGRAALLYKMEDWDGAFKIYQTILVHHRDSQKESEIVDIFFRLGNIKVDVGNAFLPANIRSQMQALGVSSLTMGSFMAAGPRSSIVDPATGNTPIDIKADNGRTLRRYIAGADGNFDLGDVNWKWDFYYSKSKTQNSTRSPDNIMPARLNQAIDAVIDPATGGTVCRSTLTHPGDGCVPYNIFGTNVNGPTEWKFIAPYPGYAMTILTQDVESANISGEPFSTWAGPVSVAFGVEHRVEKVAGTASADDVARRYFAGNYIATNAKWSVTEGFVETDVPLATDTSWAKSLNFNGAIRGAGYSESGYVTTWKAGLIYTPINDIRVRFTQSRDIRAPNLGDLFNNGRAGTGNVNDPFRGGESVTIVSADVGNSKLQPEKADTTGIGVVVSPSFFPGFTGSVDYYKINIKGAITIFGSQDALDRCFAGVQAFCTGIQRAAPTGGQPYGTITYVASQPYNALQQINSGLDFEFAYNTPLDNWSDSLAGDLDIHGLVNYTGQLDTIDVNPVTNAVSTIKGAGVNVDSAGLGTGNGLYTPHWNWTASLTYTLDRFSGTFTWRGRGAGVYNNRFVVCSSGCPASTALTPTINDNHIPAVHWYDLALNYKIMGDNATAYFVVKNLLNQDPPNIAANLSSGFYGGLDNDNYDRIGRMFRVGIRFRY